MQLSFKWWFRTPSLFLLGDAASSVCGFHVTTHICNKLVEEEKTEQPEVFVCQVYTWSHVTFVHISLVVTKFQGTLKLHMGWRVESRCLAWNEQEQNCKRCSITVLVVVDWVYLEKEPKDREGNGVSTKAWKIKANICLLINVNKCHCKTGAKLLHKHQPCEVVWRRKWQPTPVFFPGESHEQKSLVGYNPWSRRKSDTTEWLLLLPPFYRRKIWAWGWLVEN